MTTIYYVVLSASRIANATRTWQAACDIPVTDWTKTDDFILATQFGTSKGPIARAYKLQWRNKTDGGSFADVASTGEISFTATTDLTDDGTLTNTEDSDCTADEPTWQDGLESEGDNISPDTGTYSVADEQYTEFQWALDCSSALDSKEYEFQLYDVTESTVIGVCLATLTIVAAGAIEKGFTDSGAGSDVFTQAVIQQAKAFVDTGAGVDVFTQIWRAMGFSDVGSGADVFTIGYKEMGFVDVVAGADAFTTPFRAMGFVDTASGAEIFFLLAEKGFADSGLGTDIFTVPLKVIAVGFVDTGSGTDVFVTPYREMGFQDTASGLDIFELLRFLDFTDVGSGIEDFFLLVEKGVVDSGIGFDMFGITFRGLGFSDVGGGLDIFTIPFRAMGIIDSGAGIDVFIKSIVGGVIEKYMTDTSFGLDAFSCPVLWNLVDTISGLDIFLVTKPEIIIRITDGDLSQILITDGALSQMKITWEDI